MGGREFERYPLCAPSRRSSGRPGRECARGIPAATPAYPESATRDRGGRTYDTRLTNSRGEETFFFDKIGCWSPDAPDASRRPVEVPSPKLSPLAAGP